MAVVRAHMDEVLAARLKRLAKSEGRTLSAELRRAVRAWVESHGLDDGAAMPAAASSSSPPPPIIPVRSGRQRTATCIHRRPVSSFCRYCDA